MPDPRNLPPDLERPEADELAAAIVDGAAIDWRAADSTVGGEFADEFRVLEALAAVHRQPAAASSSASWDAGGPAPTEANLGAWGRLKLVACVGEGSFGKVYRAWDPSLHRHVALKLLTATSGSAASAALNEARLLARVEHPHVLTVYGAERADGYVGIWTAFIEGRTLDAIVRSSGPMSPDEVTSIGIDLCSALSAVHAANLLHRDIKAQNVMREPGGRIVLMDFGAGFDLARPARPGDFTGTPLYLAPEILRGEPASVASDIYALAVLLFYLLTGKHPVLGRTFEEVREAHRLGPTPPLRDERTDVPPELAAVVERGLSIDPTARFPSARDFEEALRARRPVDAAKLSPSRRVQPMLIAAAAALVAVAVWFVKPWRDPGHALDRTDFPASDPQLIGRQSADGRFVPYIDPDGNLVVFEVATRASRQVASKAGKDQHPGPAVMSPTGDRVVYPWTLPNGAYELRMAYSDGTWSRVLIPKESAFEPVPEDWSRDGRWITCWLKQRDGRTDLVMVPVDGGSPRVLVSSADLTTSRALISPDGRFVLYPSKAGCGQRASDGYVFCVVGTDGSLPRVVRSRGMYDQGPSWTPDSAGLLYIHGAPNEERTEAWAIPLRDGVAIGAARLIERDLGAALDVRLTDSGALTYGRFTKGGRLYTIAVESSRGHVGPPVRVSASPDDDGAGAWSPDGLWLAYFRHYGPRNGYRRPVALTIQDQHSGVETELHVALAFLSDYPAAFVPGTQAILVWGSDSGRQERLGFYRVDMTTSETKPVAFRPQLSRQPERFTATANGRGLLYVDEARGLLTYDFSSEKEVVLLGIRPGEVLHSSRVSPNGRDIAIVITHPDSSRVLTILHGGGRHDVFDTKTDDIDTVGWSPDGHEVIFSKTPLSGVNLETAIATLWRIPAEGGAPEDFHVQVPAGSQIALSPDGRRVLFTERYGLNQWFMQHNFLTGLSDILRHPTK